MKYFPSEQHLPEGQRLFKALCQPDQTEVAAEIVLCNFESVRSTRTTVKVVRWSDTIEVVIVGSIDAGYRLSLWIIIGDLRNVILKAQAFCVTIRNRMHSTIPVNTILRDRPAYRFSQNGDVSDRLRNESVNTEWYMAVEELDFAEALLRPTAQPLKGPVIKARIYIANMEWVVFPVHDPAQRTTRRPRWMYKDKTSVSRSRVILYWRRKPSDVHTTLLIWLCLAAG
jgi:hypothetical protein